ncbi:hypothetical protein PVAG01_02579 [Phlyctema vagabunda]|uniref:Developmental regulatory protein wetA n=1 Tax=Phlyctema vagabunda TaxID=108571 RepID=A0ABR4PR26_9HELO
MSLHITPAYPNDQGYDSLRLGFEDLGNDFFDQFLTFSPADNERPDFPDFEVPESTLRERFLIDGQSRATSPILGQDQLRESMADICESEYTENSTSSQHFAPKRNQFYSESTGRAAISDTELLTLEGITLQSPHLTRNVDEEFVPASPTPLRRKPRLVESLTRSLRKPSARSARSPIRKTSASPTMMCASRYSQNDFDIWGPRLQLDPTKFNFDFQQQNSPLSPPPSAKVSNASESSLISACKMDNSDPFTYNPAFSQPAQHYSGARPADYHTPLATPTLEAHHSRRPSFQQTPPDSVLFPATPQFPPSNSWPQDQTTAEYNYAASNSFVQDSDAPPVWWNHASTAPMAQPSPSTFHNNPQRATKTLAAQLQNELAYNANELAMSHSSLTNGLMISIPDDNQVSQSFVVSSPSLLSPHQTQGGYFNLQEQAPQPYHTPTRQQFTPRPQYLSSPTIGHSRNRSSSSTDSPSPKSASTPTFHVRKRRTAGQKGHEPRAPSLGGGVDFVNFTPSDSKKILTGVAPSGSSKTKARREKEALEKRRRLSQAAVRAVRAAGGSVESLVEEGLFV